MAASESCFTSHPVLYFITLTFSCWVRACVCVCVCAAQCLGCSSASAVFSSRPFSRSEHANWRTVCNSLFSGSGPSLAHFDILGKWGLFFFFLQNVVWFEGPHRITGDLLEYHTVEEIVASGFLYMQNTQLAPEVWWVTDKGEGEEKEKSYTALFPCRCS